MTDETTGPAAAPQPAVHAGASHSGTAAKAVAAIPVPPGQALLVARFPHMDTAKSVYDDLRSAETKGVAAIHRVLVANADDKGAIHIQKLTAHTSHSGYAWGGVHGAEKRAVEDELASILAPGTSGMVILVDITSLDYVTSAVPHATLVKSVPVDDGAMDQAAGGASAG